LTFFAQPLSARRKLLAMMLKKAPENIRLSKELQGTKDQLLQVAQEFGLEGLVAKRLNSLYESGRRSGAWVKVKLTRAQEFVIGDRLVLLSICRRRPKADGDWALRPRS
jgi:bifunctional non-homologous end joining protein LigD